MKTILSLFRPKPKEKPKFSDLTPKGIDHSYVPKEYFDNWPDNDLKKSQSPKIIIC